MVLTVVLSLMAGLAFRKKFGGSDALFYVAVASLIVPSIVTSLGIAIEFHVLDDLIKNYGPSWIADNYTTSMGQFTSGLGAHLTWTLPFGLLVMFAIFNRFDARYEEAARDQGATPWQTLRHVVLPIVAPSVVGVGLFGFTLSWDEIARSSQTMGEHNTLPMELQALDDDGHQPRHLRARHLDDRGLVRGHRDRRCSRSRSCARGRRGMAPTPARLERMRLLVVNPNTSASMTARIGAAARAAAAAANGDRRGQSRERSRLDRGLFRRGLRRAGHDRGNHEGRSGGRRRAT